MSQCSKHAGGRSVLFVFSSWCGQFRRCGVPHSLKQPKVYSRSSFFLLNDKGNICKKFGLSEHRSWRWLAYFHSCPFCASDFVFYLDASDEFLKDRVKTLPESLIQECNYEQELFLQRLAKHREDKLKNETALEYFDDMDISPVVLSKPLNCTFLSKYTYIIYPFVPKFRSLLNY